MSRQIDTIPSVAHMRRKASQCLPKSVFEFIDGGAEDEATLHDNRADFSRYRFPPKVLLDVSSRDLQCKIAGQPASMPVIIAPTGLAGLATPGAEKLLASAAKAQQIPFTLAALGSCDIEEVAAVGHAHKWFQIYILRERDITRQLINRAELSGYQTLVVTVDVPVAGKRERDVVNGFTVPLKWTPAMCWDMLSHPRWSLATLRAGVPAMPSLTPYIKSHTGTATHGAWVNNAFDPSATWDDLKSIRDSWPHRLLIKGILHCDDVDRAKQLGADGIVVSNHGGRQLDSAVSSIQALDRIGAQYHGQLELILDSGIRRGSDVVKALCLGASAVMIGRPTLYGAAVAGEQGVNKVLDILREEISRTMALMGVTQINQLTRSCVTHVSPPPPKAAAVEGTKQLALDTR